MIILRQKKYSSGVGRGVYIIAKSLNGVRNRVKKQLARIVAKTRADSANYTAKDKEKFAKRAADYVDFHKLSDQDLEKLIDDVGKELKEDGVKGTVQKVATKPVKYLKKAYEDTGEVINDATGAFIKHPFTSAGAVLGKFTAAAGDLTPTTAIGAGLDTAVDIVAPNITKGLKKASNSYKDFNFAKKVSKFKLKDVVDNASENVVDVIRQIPNSNLSIPPSYLK